MRNSRKGAQFSILEEPPTVLGKSLEKVIQQEASTVVLSVLQQKYKL